MRPKREERVTIKTVAERAGVSMMTVSRALRNEKRIAASTRERILKIADELGYRPNPLVGALMADLRRTSPPKATVNRIAFLTSHPSRDGWRSHPAPTALFEGALKRAEQVGFHLEPVWAKEPGLTGSRLSRILRTRGIFGVIIAPYPVPSIGTIELEWSDFAAIALGYSLREPKVHRVTNHHLESMRIALRELTRRGYKRLGLAMPAGHNERVHHNWATGFLHYQAGLPAQDRIPIYMPAVPRRDEFLAWRHRHKPDAILGTVGLKWLREEGVNMPEEVGFVSLDFYPAWGDVAGIVQNHEAVGAGAVDLVVEQLYHNERGIPALPKIVMLEGKWREGSTVRAAPKAEKTGNAALGLPHLGF